MPERSSMYFYVDWTKQRIDEMDGTLASLEAEASRLKADSRAKAEQFITGLKKRRDEFQAKAKAGLESRRSERGCAIMDCGDSNRDCRVRAHPLCGSDQEGGTSALAVSRQGKERR